MFTRTAQTKTQTTQAGLKMARKRRMSAVEMRERLQRVARSLVRTAGASDAGDPVSHRPDPYVFWLD